MVPPLPLFLRNDQMRGHASVTIAEQNFMRTDVISLPVIGGYKLYDNVYRFK